LANKRVSGNLFRNMKIGKKDEKLHLKAEKFIRYAEKKGYGYLDIVDFMEHYENQKSNAENLKKLKKFLRG